MITSSCSSVMCLYNNDLKPEYRELTSHNIGHFPNEIREKAKQADFVIYFSRSGEYNVLKATNPKDLDRV